MNDDDGSLPPHLQRELDQMGVFGDDLDDDETLNIAPRKSKKEREKDRYAMPEIEFDPKTGEPNF